MKKMQLLVIVMGTMALVTTAVNLGLNLAILDTGSKSEKYYRICDGKHDYYTENYEYDSSSNTIKFIDIDGREVIVYGSASIISPKGTTE